MVEHNSYIFAVKAVFEIYFKTFKKIKTYSLTNIVFDIFDSDLNYCIHKQSLTDYHLQKLKYSSSKWIMTVPKGNVGGAGSEEDKIYHLAWEFKNDWNNKYNELQNEYQKY